MAKKQDGYLSAKESRRISKENRRITDQYEKKRKRRNVPESEYTVQMHDEKNAVEFDNLHTYFFTDTGVVKSVDGVSFEVPVGKTVGVVGESGCGKSVTSLSLMQLLQRPQGQIVDGEIRLNLGGGKAYDIAKTPADKMQGLRGNYISMIFQEPMTSLNPVFRIGAQIDEVIALHEGEGKTKEDIKKRTIEMLETVGIANSNGVSPDQYLMTSLLDSASTPSIFLIGSGIIMVVALLTSKKAHNVIKTSLDLSRQEAGEESFGTSPIARKLVRMTTNTSSFIVNNIPPKARTWLNARFDKDEVILEHGAAFDLIRASVNLVLASLLIALGTSLKLPLSTTYVTFMVAMGTSLADRAWGRDSAVYRITGVISVIGGWFLTAGAAFLICFTVTMIVYFGGSIAIILLGVLAAYMLIHSQISYNKKLKQEKNSSLAQQMVANKDKQEALVLLRKFSREEFAKVLEWSADLYHRVTTGFLNESYRTLRKAMGDIETERRYFKQVKRLGTIGVSHLNDKVGLEKGLYYFQGNDFSYDIIHSIKRTCEPCLEHTDNNFNPLEQSQKDSFGEIAQSIVSFLEESRQSIEKDAFGDLAALYNQGNILINQLGVLKREEIRHMREQVSYIKVGIVYLTVIQESQNVVAYTINLLKMNQKFQEGN